MRYEITFQRNGRKLPPVITLVDSTLYVARQCAEIGKQHHEAEAAWIHDGNGNLIDYLVAPTQAPEDPRSLTHLA